ncbi:MAG: DNA polymerase Y family protein [Sphingomonas sp.]
MLGIHPGMALTQARAQVPGLDIRPADPAGDLADLHRLAVAFARRWSPIVAIADADTLFLDVTGVAHLFGGEAAMAARIARLLARIGFIARIAIADTAGAAWALVHHAPSRHPRESGGPAGLREKKRGPRFRGDDEVLICPPGDHAQAIAPLPTVALRIDPAAIELLRRLGVDRIGTLAAMPRAPLVRRFGVALALQLDRALGLAPEPLDPVVPPRMIVASRRFAEPIATAEAIGHWLGRLVPELTRALALAGLGARRIELVADRVDGVPQRVGIGLAWPSRDPAHLVRLLARRIEAIEPGYGIDALALHVPPRPAARPRADRRAARRSDRTRSRAFGGYARDADRPRQAVALPPDRKRRPRAFGGARAGARSARAPRAACPARRRPTARSRRRPAALARAMAPPRTAAPAPRADRRRARADARSAAAPLHLARGHPPRRPRRRARAHPRRMVAAAERGPFDPRLFPRRG